jgi:hypothetical protein
VTPSFNQAGYLQQTIESVLGQGYPNLEYIIMDGGSQDGSVEIIRRYEKYLTYWQSQPDGGQYAAVHEGLKRTTGEIMTWINSDDLLRPGAFLTAAAVFSEQPHVEWITGANHVIDEHGATLSALSVLPQFSRAKYLTYQYDNIFVQQEGTFWRRALWEQAGGYLNTELDYAGDLELWTRFFRHAQLHVVSLPLASFRKQPNQKTSLFMDRYHAEAFMVIERENELYNDKTYPLLPPAPPPIYLQELSCLVEPPLSTPQAYNILLADDGDDSHLQHCLQALQGVWQDESIGIFVLSDRVEMEREALLAASLGISDDKGRLVWLAYSKHPLRFFNQLTAADLIIGAADVVEEARRRNLPATSEPTAEWIRTATSAFAGLDWRPEPFELETAAPERWLLPMAGDWPSKFEAFLQNVAADAELELLLRVPPGQAETAQETLLVWLDAHAYDPESLPNITLLDPEWEAEVRIHRAATGFIDTGDTLSRAVAAAVGLKPAPLEVSS